MLDYRQIVVRQITGDLPGLRMVDHVCKCRRGVIQRRRQPPPKTGHHLRSFARPSLVECHEAVLNCCPEMWCNCCSPHAYMILLRRLDFNTLSAEGVWKLI